MSRLRVEALASWSMVQARRAMSQCICMLREYLLCQASVRGQAKVFQWSRSS